MKRLLLAAVGLVAVTVTTALAADMPPSRPLPPPRAPAFVPFFTWNGFYTGINAGYGFGSSKWTDTITQATTGSFNVNGPLVGATVGYNMQAGSWVFGLEGDIGWSNIKGSTTCPVGVGTCETKNNWLGTTRGRIGYAFDRFMPYITGGMAFGDVKGSVLGFGSFSETKIGWTAGVGGEYFFTDNWSAKLEYLYVDLGNGTCDAACSGANPVDVLFKTNIVRGGVNYKF